MLNVVQCPPLIKKKKALWKTVGITRQMYLVRGNLSNTDTVTTKTNTVALHCLAIPTSLFNSVSKS